ncbi:MAG: hypothetical protein ACD_46C00059G0001, partial [uncultured bacterium]
ILNKNNPFPTEKPNTANPVYMLDLTQSTDLLLKKLSKVHRYELRQWEISSANLITDKSRLLTGLFDLYRKTLSRVNASALYYFQTETLSHLVESKNTIAIGVITQGKLEAISLFLHTPYIADYFINASTIDGRRHARGLLWTGIEMLKQLSIPSLNLGGGIKPNDNLDKYKRRFGGVLYSSPVLKQIYNQEKFDMLCKKIYDHHNYFPPYHT